MFKEKGKRMDREKENKPKSKKYRYNWEHSNRQRERKVENLSRLRHSPYLQTFTVRRIHTIKYTKEKEKQSYVLGKI